MSDQDMFSKGDEQNTNPKETNNQEQPKGEDLSQSSGDIFADKLKEILNEHGEPKYKTTEDALEALGHSQKFIEQLKAEKKALEEQYTQTQSELETRESVEEVVKRLTGQSQPNETKGDQPQVNGLDEEKVQELVKSMLSQREQESRASLNMSTVQAALIEQYGDKAKSVIQSKAKEMGTTTDELRRLAEQNPKMALTLLGGSTPVSNTPTSSSASTPRHDPNALERPKFEKSLVRGGISNRELADAFKQVSDYTNKRLGVE